jgi:putative addiction module killer protein
MSPEATPTGMKHRGQPNAAQPEGNIYVTIGLVPEIEIQEYLDPDGRSPFARWFDGLNAVAAARITIALMRLGQGNFSNVEGVGAGFFELKIDFGPGYRVYFGKDGQQIVILLGGSSKKRQSAAIAVAQAAWAAYKRRRDGKE